MTGTGWCWGSTRGRCSISGHHPRGHPTGPTFQLLTLDAVGMVLNVGFLLWFLRSEKAKGKQVVT